MRTIIIAAASACAAFVVGGIMSHGSAQGTADVNSPVRRQVLRATNTLSTTSSSDWTRLDALSGISICARRRSGVRVDLSVDVSGAPIEVRVAQNGDVMRPEGAWFDPGETRQSSSFLFVDRAPFTSDALYDVEWRSPSGEPAQLNRGTVALLYVKATRTGCD